MVLYPIWDKLVIRETCVFLQSYQSLSYSHAQSVASIKALNKHQSGKPGTIRESNETLGAHYVSYCVQKSSILLAGTGVRKMSSVACGFSSVKIYFSDYPKSLISRINEVYVFFNKISL